MFGRKPFTIENGLLTANGKLKRDAIARQMRDEIEEMYRVKRRGLGGNIIERDVQRYETDFKARHSRGKSRDGVIELALHREPLQRNRLPDAGRTGKIRRSHSKELSRTPMP